MSGMCLSLETKVMAVFGICRFSSGLFVMVSRDFVSFYFKFIGGFFIPLLWICVVLSIYGWFAVVGLVLCSPSFSSCFLFSLFSPITFNSSLLIIRTLSTANHFTNLIPAPTNFWAWFRREDKGVLRKWSDKGVLINKQWTVDSSSGCVI